MTIIIDAFSLVPTMHIPFPSPIFDLLEVTAGVRAIYPRMDLLRDWKPGKPNRADVCRAHESLTNGIETVI